MNRSKIFLVLIAFLAVSCEEMDSLFNTEDNKLTEEKIGRRSIHQTIMG